MRQIEHTLEAIDRFQRRSKPAGFLFGVVKKFGNDNGGSLAALMAYYGFLSLFPLMLLLVTIVGLATGGSVSATQRVEHSALSQFPVIGAHLGQNIQALHDRAGLGLAIGIIGLIWGSQGVIQSAQYAMAQVWNVPLVDRPGYVARLLRTLAVMAAVGVFLLASTALAGVVTVGNRGGLEVVGAVVVSLLLNVAIFAVAFRLLTPSAIPSRWLFPGAVVGAVGWTILQYVGGTLVDHTLRNTSQVYGFFASRARPRRLDLPRYAADRLRRRAQRGAPSPTLAAFPPGSPDRRRPGGAEPHRARAAQPCRPACLRALRHRCGRAGGERWRSGEGQ